MSTFAKSIVEQAAVALLETAGWSVRHGAEIKTGGFRAERFLGRAG